MAPLTLFACGEPPVFVADPCSGPLGGAPWESSSTLPESLGDLDEALAAIPVSEVPHALDTSGVYFLNTALLAYALEVPETMVVPEVTRKRTANVHPQLGSGVLKSFAGGTLDTDLLRRVVHRYYACDRAHPTTREDFKKMYGDYHAFPSRVVEYSIAKQSERTLYENPSAGVYVAEDNGETEVILEGHRKDGALDFLVYDAAGKLRDRVPLAIGSQKEVMPAPFACINCHRNIVTNTIDIVDPSNP